MNQTMQGITKSMVSQNEVLPINLTEQKPEVSNLPDMTVRGVFSADLTLMKMLRLQEQMDEIEVLYQDELTHLEHWKKQRLSVLEKQFKYYSDSVEAWLSISGEKSYRLPHGDIKFRVQPDRVVIQNEEKLLLQPEFVRIKRSPDKKAILKAYRENGLIPDGTDVIQQDDKFYVKLIKAKGENDV